MTMDSQETKTEDFELPKPTGNTMPAGGTPEHGPAPELSAAPSGMPASAGTHFMTPPAAHAAATVTGATAPLAASSSTAGLTAEDADLIEKTWIEKAKQIVAETRGDPYTQNKEINKVKADYIKKRYNKDIKLASE